MVFGWRVGSNPVFCLVRGICRDGMDVHLTPLATVKYGPHVSSSIVFSFFPLHLIFFLQLAAAAPRAPRDGPLPPRAPGSASAPPRPWWRPEVRTALPAPRVCLRPAPSSSPRATSGWILRSPPRRASRPPLAPSPRRHAHVAQPPPRHPHARIKETSNINLPSYITTIVTYRTKIISLHKEQILLNYVKLNKLHQKKMYI